MRKKDLVIWKQLSGHLELQNCKPFWLLKFLDPITICSSSDDLKENCLFLQYSNKLVEFDHWNRHFHVT